jgi:HPt (histidine-containing phosphotransfer) domain-containing protein
LRKLIIDFGQRFAGATEELHDQISRGALEDARRSAHTLKGVAGSLELAEIYAHAAKTEAALSQGDVVAANGLIAELEQLLKPAIQAAQSLVTAPETANNAASAAEAEPVNIQAEISAFRGLLERRSLKARSSFEKLATTLGMTPADMQVHPVKVALDNLDYNRALTLLNEEFADDPQTSGNTERIGE